MEPAPRPGGSKALPPPARHTEVPEVPGFSLELGGGGRQPCTYSPAQETLPEIPLCARCWLRPRGHSSEADTSSLLEPVLRAPLSGTQAAPTKQDVRSRARGVRREEGQPSDSRRESDIS